MLAVSPSQSPRKEENDIGLTLHLNLYLPPSNIENGQFVETGETFTLTGRATVSFDNFDNC